MNKQLMLVVAVVAACAAELVLATGEYYPSQQHYEGLDEQPIGANFNHLAGPTSLDYNAPAVPAGQTAPGEVRRSVAGHVRNLVSVVGHNGKQLVKDAQPALLGIKSDLMKTKDKIVQSPHVVKVKGLIPTASSIKQQTAPYVAKGQEKLGGFVEGIRTRHQRRRERYHQQQQQQDEQAGLNQQQQQQPSADYPNY